MHKRTITYVDFDGNERKEDHYFNLTRAELIEMETSITGGMSTMLQQISDKVDIPQLMKNFKIIMLKAYGIKSPDGRSFKKSEEISNDFESTGAYDALYTTLVTNAKEAVDFINAIIPPQPANATAPQVTPAT